MLQSLQETNLDVHFALRLQHAGREDAGAEQRQESSDDGHVLGSEVHASARVATTAFMHPPLLVDQLHHCNYPDAVQMVRIG